MNANELIDKIFTVTVEASSILSIDIYPCFEKVSADFRCRFLPFDCGWEYRSFISNSVGEEKQNKEGKWTKRFKKAVEIWAKERGRDNPTKNPEWEIFFQELVRQFKLQENEKTFTVTFKSGMENLVDAVKVNESSCYMHEYASSIDTLVYNDGIVMITCDENGELDYNCRAWIFLQKENEEINAAALFNGYFFNDNDPTQIAARVFEKISGIKPVKKEKSYDNVYVNNAVIYTFSFTEDFDLYEITEITDGDHNLNCNGIPCQCCEDESLF